MKTETLENLLTSELKDIYSAENQMLGALSKIIGAAESEDLRDAFEKCLDETRRHADHIKEICTQLDVEPAETTCLGMGGIVEESRDVLNSGIDPELLNVALIGVAQRMEHYEIAAYGTTRAHARQLGLMSIAELLGQTLEEKKKADAQLTYLAENRINVEAAMHQHDMKALAE